MLALARRRLLRHWPVVIIGDLREGDVDMVAWAALFVFALFFLNQCAPYLDEQGDRKGAMAVTRIMVLLDMLCPSRHPLSPVHPHVRKCRASCSR